MAIRCSMPSPERFASTWPVWSHVQHGASAPVDGASVFSVQRDDIVRPAVRVLEVQVREGLPTAAQTDDLDVVLTAAISHALNDCVEAGNVAAARKNADAFSRQADLPALACRNNARVTRSLLGRFRLALLAQPETLQQCGHGFAEAAILQFGIGQHRGARPALAAHLDCLALGAPADLVPRRVVVEIGVGL